MFSNLLPDGVFQNYAALTPDFLIKSGIKALVLDIDNTVAPYEMAEPDAAVSRWISQMKESGIALAFVSNNAPARVNLFNRTLGLPAYPKAKKPFVGRLRTALASLGVAPHEAASLGDQLFTDVWAAKRLGMRAYTVPPIRDKRDLLTRLKRRLEKPLYRRFYQQQTKEND